MMAKILAAQFDGQEVHRIYDDVSESWWFSVTDVVQVLTQQPDDLAARKYWNHLKRRLGKLRLTDVASAQTLLRLVQSEPSPKAQPIKLWLAKVGAERMQEMADPALSLDRASNLAAAWAQ